MKKGFMKFMITKLYFKSAKAVKKDGDTSMLGDMVNIQRDIRGEVPSSGSKETENSSYITHKPDDEL